MTNLEWVMKNKKLLKEILQDTLAVSNGKIKKCTDIACSNCDFIDSQYDECSERRKEWLEAEYEPTYKKGDIVILKNRDIVIVTREANTATSVIVSGNIGFTENGEGWFVYFDDIERKVGNIYD